MSKQPAAYEVRHSCQLSCPQGATVSVLDELLHNIQQATEQVCPNHPASRPTAPASAPDKACFHSYRPRRPYTSH